MLNRRKKNPARVMAIGFVGLIFIGSILLSLPFSYEAAEFGYLDALFTAASAVCVTGLVVVDTGTFFTPFGQSVVMALIFIGALGFMTMTTLTFIFLGRKVSLQERLVVKEILDQESIAGLVSLVKAVFWMALVFVVIGTVLLSIRFVPAMGYERGIFFSLFHAISAFGNAGFDLFGNFQSLTSSPTDYLVNGTIMTLFIIGGLGFTVILEFVNRISLRHRLTLHSKLVVIITAVLLSSGTVIILLLEYSNPGTMGNLSFGDKVFTALFTAATPRTAGFSVLDTAAMGHTTMVMLLALMFIGASPTSTGGGIKTTTFAIVFFTFVSMIRGKHEPVVYYTRFSLSQVMKAVSIIMGAIFLVFLSTIALTILENQDFMVIVFEVVSAFGTVGLSTGVTPELSSAAKLVLIITMYAGRIGPLTLLVALTRERKDDVLNYPEEHLLMG